MKNFERFASSVTCEGVCFQNLLTTNVISSKAWSTIELLLVLFLHTTLTSNIFLFPTRSPRFLLRLYAMRGYCSNAVYRFEFICNKCVY